MSLPPVLKAGSSGIYYLKKKSLIFPTIPESFHTHQYATPQRVNEEKGDAQAAKRPESIRIIEREREQ